MYIFFQLVKYFYIDVAAQGPCIVYINFDDFITDKNRPHYFISRCLINKRTFIFFLNRHVHDISSLIPSDIHIHLYVINFTSIKVKQYMVATFNRKRNHSIWRPHRRP